MNRFMNGFKASFLTFVCCFAISFIAVSPVLNSHIIIESEMNSSEIFNENLESEIEEIENEIDLIGFEFQNGSDLLISANSLDSLHKYIKDGFSNNLFKPPTLV